MGNQDISRLKSDAAVPISQIILDINSRFHGVLPQKYLTMAF